MGTTEGMNKTHDLLKSELGEEAYLKLLKNRAAKGGSVKSEAKRMAAKLREAKKREARSSR